jgi:glutaredoxin 3
MLPPCPLQVFVFSKSYCPYCRKTKGLLFELQHNIDVGVDFLEIDELPEKDGQLVQSYLQKITGQRTVPSIFINQEHIGGNSDLHQLHETGKLEGLLLEAAKLGAPEL